MSPPWPSTWLRTPLPTPQEAPSSSTVACSARPEACKREPGIALACEKQARTYEDQHDSQYQLKRLAGDPGRHPAPDKDTRDAAQQQGPGQGEVHVALRHVSYANDEREDHRVCDICADYNGRCYGIEKEQYDGHHAPRSDGGEPDQVTAQGPEKDGIGPAPTAHPTLAVPYAGLRALVPLWHEVVAVDQGHPYQNEGRGYDRDHDRLDPRGVEGTLYPLQGPDTEQPGRDAAHPQKNGDLDVDRALPEVLERPGQLGEGGEGQVGPDGGGGRDSHHSHQKRRHERPTPDPREAYKETDEQPEESGRGIYHARLSPVERPDRREIAELFQVADDPGRALPGLLFIGLDVQLGGGGRLVRVGHTGELRDLPRESLLVEALDVPLGAHLQGSIDEDLDEVLTNVAPHLVTHLLEGRDSADDHTYPVARQQVGDEPYPQDIGVPVLPGKTKALG